MIRFSGRIARYVFTAGIATTAAVTGMAGSATAGTPSALPTATVRAAGAADAIPGSYIVVLKSGSDAPAEVPSASNRLVRRYGGRVLTNYLATVRGFHATMTATEAARLAANPAVQFVEQDAKVTLSATQNRPTWGLDRIDQRSLPLSTTYTAPSLSTTTPEGKFSCPSVFPRFPQAQRNVPFPSNF